jgi:SAM-dependent methyltransferase
VNLLGSNPVEIMVHIITATVDIRPCPNCGSSNRITKFIEPPFQIVMCSDCALVYLGNPPDEGLIYEQYYESTEPDGRKYRAISDDPFLAELHAINTQRSARIAGIKPSGRLLDVGCGRGNFLTIARDYGYDVYGIDISDRAVAYARKQFNLNIDVATLDDIARTENRFDVITLWHVLEHFVDPFKHLLQVRSLLKEGGICVIEVPNLNSLKFRIARHKWHGGNHPLYHRTFFSMGTLRHALVKTGFSDVHRLRLTYRIPGRSKIYEGCKAALNVVGMDAFLAFVARR